MKAKNLRWAAFLLVGVLPWGLAARAQEDVVAVEPDAEPVEEEREAPPAERRPDTRFLFEIGYLGTTTVGGDHRIGTEYSPETGTFKTLYLPEDMASGTMYRAGFKLPEDRGEIVGRYWSSKVDTGTVVSRPGDFVFGITETVPFAHGVADDGLADAIEASASFKTRDGDLSWRFRLVDTERFQFHMATGLRKLMHREDSSISYVALDPGLPSLIEPGGGDLTGLLGPVPDRASTLSEFEGNGLQFGIDAVVPLFGDRLQFEASASIAVLRGTTRSSYATNTSFYILDTGIAQIPITYEEFVELVELGAYGFLSQQTLTLAIENPGRSTTASALDLSIGLRSRIWRGIEVALGAKLTRYEDVVYDLRPEAPSLSPVGSLTFGGVEETWRSIGYEAFYASAAYRF
jgi:hypothetical protein